MIARRALAALTAASALALSVASCDRTPAPTEELFNRVEAVDAAPDGMIAADTLEARAVDFIRGADRHLAVAFEDLDSVAVADALVEAQGRGVEVQIVGDADSAGQRGFRRLSETLAPGPDGAIPLRFGDGALTYSPQPTVTLTRTGEMNRMTHNFIIADGLRVFNTSGGFPTCSPGETCEPLRRWQFGFEARSEDLAKDFGDEFVQMYGGVFSINLDTFNGPQKSDANARAHYPSDVGDIELYFGPQERLLKRVIDAIYGARASVYVLTEEFANEFAAEALVYKVSTGFAVRVATAPDGAACEETAGCPGFQRCVQQRCEIPYNAIDRLVTGFADERRSPLQKADVRLLPGVQGTVVVIDAERSPISGERYQTRVMVLSQPMTSGISYTRGQTSIPRPADSFMDSNMWVINEFPHAENPTARALIERVQAGFAASEEAAP